MREATAALFCVVADPSVSRSDAEGCMNLPRVLLHAQRRAMNACRRNLRVIPSLCKFFISCFSEGMTSKSREDQQSHISCQAQFRPRFIPEKLGVPKAICASLGQ
eukprot:COSAG02_NODE_803_length_17021_cov_18.597270_5_plen_105_part_00